MYHDVVSDTPDESGFPGPAAARYKLPWTAFLAHLDGIERSAEVPPHVVYDLVATPKTPSWLLTFDDGGASMLRVGDELARRHWRGHFFIVANLIGEPGFLDAAAIRKLRRMGHVIGSHSVSHPERMSSLSDEELRREWQTSVLALSDLLDEEVRTASVPGGYYTKRVAIAADKAGIAALFTSEPVRRPRWVGDCIVVGRLSVRWNTNAEETAAAAAGRSAPWVRQYASWNLRKPIKAIAGERYEQLVAKVVASPERAPLP